MIQRCVQFWLFRKGYANSFSTTLCMIFQKKCFSCCILLTGHISLSDCLYFLRYWEMCALQLLVNQIVCHKFWNYHFSTWPKSLDKIEISWERKQLLRWNKQAFFIIFKGHSEVKHCLRVRLYYWLLFSCYSVVFNANAFYQIS